jgi:formylglycine-generating enzyme required for sulfatase activity
MQSDALELNTLLEQIRLRGIPVSTVEMQRLNAVFQGEPRITRAELRELLCALLAKDDTQRRTIRRLFEQLVPFDETPATPDTTNDTQAFSPSQPRQALEAETPVPLPKPKKPRDYWFIGWVSMLLLALLLLLLWHPWSKPPDAPPTSPDTERSETKLLPSQPPPEEKIASDLKLVDSIEVWKAEVKVTRQDLWKDLLPNLILFLGAGLGFFWLLNKAMQRIWIRTPEPPLLRPQPGRFHLPRLKNLTDYHLLSGADRREMSWGINHYLTDIPFNKLDIPASVNASARSGLPAIEYQHATREREVWLWQDQDSGNADLLKLAEEIGDTLHSAKIEVQRGYFRGLPDMIRNERGEVIWSTKHEYPEHQPLVVVLVDGNSLVQMGALQKPEAHIAFRQLGHWATLCLVDCSQQPGGLCNLTKAYDLDCLQPHEVAGWLARQGEPPQAQVTACAIDSLHLWAIACCLPERALMEDEMRALHDTLGLNCAWQYHALRRYAEPAGLGLDFSRSRLMLLQEFARLAERDATLMDTVITFWRQRTDEIDAALCAEETEQRPWKDTLKQQRLYLERALLGLWRTLPLVGASPAGDSFSAQTLYDLHALPKLKAEVERKLGQYTCQGWAETPGVTPANPGGWICLPPQWEALSPQTQHQLKAAGLGGKAEKLSLHWDKATSILLGVLFGLMVVAFGQGVWVSIPKPASVQTVLNSAQEPVTALQYPEKITNDSQVLWLGTAKYGVEKRDIQPNDRVPVKWVRQIQAARIRPPDAPFAKGDEDDEVELWLAGENARPVRPPDWPPVSVAVIAASPDNPDVQRLAAKLLDNGTADQVLIGKDWRKHQRDIMQQWPEMPDMQWLYVMPHAEGLPAHGKHFARFIMSPADLLGKLATPGVYAADKLQTGATLNGQPRLIGSAPKLASIELPHGMKLLRIPQGSFKMGSEKGQDDEKPVHTVNIAYDLRMSATEVTFAQYDAYVQATKGKEKPDDSGWGRDTRPVINVSWDDAQGYVKWLSENNGQGLSCRLPSEAEWEYAARAGTTTDYPWGDKASHEYANYGKDECCGGLAVGKDQWVNTAPVGSFPANQFGLQDMHGNVLEWTQDCWHDNYTDAPTDGTAWESGGDCGRRVVRGGSWGLGPGRLRASDRLVNARDYRDFSLGFRVVCGLPLPDR